MDSVPETSVVLLRPAKIKSAFLILKRQKVQLLVKLHRQFAGKKPLMLLWQHYPWAIQRQKATSPYAATAFSTDTGAWSMSSMQSWKSIVGIMLSPAVSLNVIAPSHHANSTPSRPLSLNSRLPVNVNKNTQVSPGVCICECKKL